LQHEEAEAMNVVVTGGAGYIGGTVATLLVRAGHRVTVVDNLCHARREAIPEGVEFVQADIADRAAMEALLRQVKPDGVLHFAALIEAGESMQKPEMYFRNNVAGTLALLEAMLATDVKKLVFSSTAAVYGEPESVPIEETARLAPTNAYGESKLISEQMLRWFEQVHGFRCAVLRYFNVAGALAGRGEEHEPESHLIPLVLDAALGLRSSIAIFGDDYDTPDGTCIRDYIHVVDLAEAHILALEALEKQGGLLVNLGNGEGFSVKQVIETARRVTGCTIVAELKPRRSGDPARLVASAGKANRVLGWKPQHAALEDIISSAWQWHKQRFGEGN
jgi:UDP-glucose 4-epimerase